MRGLLVSISWFRWHVHRNLQHQSTIFAEIVDVKPWHWVTVSAVEAVLQGRGTPRSCHEALPPLRNKHGEWSTGYMLPSLNNLDKSGYALIRTPLFTRLFPPHVSMRSLHRRAFCASYRMRRCRSRINSLAQPREPKDYTRVRRGFEKTIPGYLFRHPSTATDSSHRLQP